MKGLNQKEDFHFQAFSGLGNSWGLTFILKHIKKNLYIITISNSLSRQKYQKYIVFITNKNNSPRKGESMLGSRSILCLLG